MNTILNSKLCRNGVFFLFILIGMTYNSIAQQTSDPLALPRTKSILQYMSTLSSLPSKKVLSGQWMNMRGFPETPSSEFDTAITSIYNQTSKWVGIIGTEYMREITVPKYSKAITGLQPVNQELIKYSNKNGIVTVMCTFKNPWTNGNQYDMTGSNNLLDIVTDGSIANLSFKKELDSIANGFKQLQDSGVTVLFRPFHEMNGAWFWWGSKSSTLPIASDFTALWKFVYTYLTTTKNLHNILWFYTPSARDKSISNPNFKTELFYYPGNEYVDVIGLDIYSDTLDIPNYSALVSTGKPIGIAEFGPKKTTVTNLRFVYDYTTLINQIRNKYPALCFWISYNHFKSGSTTNWVNYSLSTQKNTSQLLIDPWVANRDDISGYVTYSSTAYSIICVNTAPFALTGGNPSGGIYSGKGVINGIFHPEIAGVGTTNIIYSITESNGNISTASDSIFVRNLPNVSYVNTTQSNICVNASPFQLTGGKPLGGIYSGYSVKNGTFDPSLAGIGKFKILYLYTDSNGCSNIDSGYIVVNNPTTSTITTSAQDSFSLNGTTYTQTGRYTQILKNSKGCDSTITLNLTITTTSVEEEISESDFTIYPNPSNGKFIIESNRMSDFSSSTEFQLYNVLGEKVFSAQLINPRMEIETHLPSGVYLYHLKIQNTIIIEGKIMLF